MSYGKEELRDLFSRPFDEDLWGDVLADLFGVKHDPQGGIREVPQEIDRPFPDARGWFLGSFTTADGYLVGLFRFETDSVRRRRVGLRNLLRPMLRWTHDAALAVFTERGSDVWRFSFVCDLKGDATAPKRFTYVFGDPASPCRTPVQRFLALGDAREAGRPVSFAAMQDAFSVEALSDEFFREYKNHYETFVSRITGKRFVKDGGKWIEIAVGRPDRDLYATFGNDDKRVRDYVKKLLGRLVFLHFLQKKGWLGAKTGGWTGGDPAFLLHLFEFATPEQQDDFLVGVLENLFFNALNTDRSASGDLFDTGVPGIGKCRIPYLNGGLFERDGLDELPVRFPAAFFRNLLRFFAEYNFTIDENDTDEAEVGIDPEMLGRIFENLLEDNKDKGAFYTPKEIVRYMCRQSLLAHLSEGEDEAGAVAIADFLDSRDPDPLPKPLAARLAVKLRDVKICDPAIGSGAFPMGLLRELSALRSALVPDAPDLKRQIIENNIYGVDIEQGAVDIARLRFWLALVVDADAPTPLPNLDFKIMQGNSLVESWKGHDLSRLLGNKPLRRVLNDTLPDLPAPPQQLLLFGNFTAIQRKRLYNLLHQWFSCANHAKRSILRKQIHVTVEEQIQSFWPDFSFGNLDPSANSEFFLWHLWFAEVFERGGFDIVIGNPPYISAPAQIAHPLLARQRRSIAGSGRYPSLFEKWDLYLAFLELGMRHLLRDGGRLAMIVPYPLTNQKYARKFREAAVSDWMLTELADLRGVKVFQNATVTNCIPFLQKKIGASCPDVWISRADERGVVSRLFRQPIARLVIDSTKAVWNTDPTNRSTTRHSDYPTLGDICYISVGMVLNADEKTARGDFTKDDLISDTKDAIHCREYIEAKDMDRYVVNRIRFLEYGTRRSPGALRRPTFPELYNRGKLIANRLGSLTVFLDEKQHYLHNDSCFSLVPWQALEEVHNKSIASSIKKFSRMERSEMVSLSKGFDLRYLLGILNSRYAQVLLTRIRGGDYHIYPEHLRAIPIPHAIASKQARMARIVDRILAAKSADPSADTSVDERRIDKLVYSLYGLTPDEIAAVESENA